MDELLTPADAARILGVTPAAVRNMADRGRLSIAAQTSGGIRLFRRQAVEALARLREKARREQAQRVG